MLQWIWANLVGVAKDGKTRKQVREALTEVAQDFQTLSEKTFGIFETGRWWHKALTKMATEIVRNVGLPNPDFFPPIPGKPHSYPRQAARELRAVRYAEKGKDAPKSSYSYVLCGHTHKPEVVALDPGSPGAPCSYINTGCWRRSHGFAAVPMTPRGGTFSFSTWQEECLVIVYSQEEQAAGNPSFHFHRVTRGHR